MFLRRMRIFCRAKGVFDLQGGVWDGLPDSVECVCANVNNKEAGVAARLRVVVIRYRGSNGVLFCYCTVMTVEQLWDVVDQVNVYCSMMDEVEWIIIA
jgi:hypothetical protein